MSQRRTAGAVAIAAAALVIVAGVTTHRADELTKADVERWTAEYIGLIHRLAIYG